LDETKLLEVIQECTTEKFTIEMLSHVPKQAPSNQITFSIRPLLGKHLLMMAPSDKRLGVCRGKYVQYAIDLETGEKEILFTGTLLAGELFFLKKFQGEAEFVQLKASLVIDQEYYIVTQYCNRGDWLKEIIDRTLSFQETIQAALDVTRGVKRMHAEGVVHRDLKLNNLFIHQEKNGRIHGVIGDFNLMDQGKEVEAGSDLLGVTMCVSPERAKIVISKKEVGENKLPQPMKEDVWMLGLVFFYWFRGGVLQWHQNLKDCLDRDMEAMRRCAQLNQEEFSEELRRSKLPPFFVPLIESMLQIDPEKRATASTVYTYLIEIAKVIEKV